MPLDHYLPATHLASFSADGTGSRRDRRLAAADLVEDRIFSSTAGNLCAVNDFYTLTNHPSRPRLIDEVFQGYEANLAEAVAHLIRGTLDARTWLRVLVPFVAAVLVRGPDFNARFEDRIRSLGLDPSPDNTNHARLFELQRLLAPVLAAEWIVLSARGHGVVIINDLGFVPFANFRTAHLGLAFPLDLEHVLVVVPRRRAPVVIEVDGGWFPIISYTDLEPDNHVSLNRVLSSSAHRFVFGPDERALTPYLATTGRPRRVPEPEELGFITGRLSVVHEFAWHRLVGVVEKSPLDPDTWDFTMDWQSLAAGWVPLLVLPMNLPEFPPALTRSGRVISIDLFDIPGFTTEQ